MVIGLVCLAAALGLWLLLRSTKELNSDPVMRFKDLTYTVLVWFLVAVAVLCFTDAVRGG